jgi:phosphatidylserine decarboxylase
VATALLAAVGQFWAALGLATVTASLGAFFRDPSRHSDSPADRVLSPADGRVVAVQSDAQGVDIAIFLSVFNVHVTRAPMDGELTEWERIPGGYAMAFRDTATDNARHRVVIDTPRGKAELSLIAGAVARRVVPFVFVPSSLRRGQRIALIKFGSRAELRLLYTRLLPPTLYMS